MNIQLFEKLTITNFYSINHTFSEVGSSNVRKDRPSCAIVFKYDGETEYKNRNQKITADKDHIAFLPKGSKYKWVCTKAGHYFIIEFDCSYENKDLLVCKIENHNVIKDMFNDIMSESVKHDTFSYVKILNLIYKLIINLLESNYSENEQKTKIKFIRPAIAYLNSNFQNNISNNQLAAMCNISTSYFRRIFTEIYQISPFQYLVNLRIKKAKELLQSDYTSITEVAKQVGYDDIYHFSKLFKQKTGTSPLNYLKNKTHD